MFLVSFIFANVFSIHTQTYISICLHASYACVLEPVNSASVCFFPFVFFPSRLWQRQLYRLYENTENHFHVSLTIEKRLPVSQIREWMHIASSNQNAATSKEIFDIKRNILKSDYTRFACEKWACISETGINISDFLNTKAKKEFVGAADALCSPLTSNVSTVYREYKKKYYSAKANDICPVTVFSNVMTRDIQWFFLIVTSFACLVYM